MSVVLKIWKDLPGVPQKVDWSLFCEINYHLSEFGIYVHIIGEVRNERAYLFL